MPAAKKRISDFSPKRTSLRACSSVSARWKKPTTRQLRRSTEVSKRSACSVIDDHMLRRLSNPASVAPAIASSDSAVPAGEAGPLGDDRRGDGDLHVRVGVRAQVQAGVAHREPVGLHRSPARPR